MMKLSEAIRKGAQLRPQGFGDYFVAEPGTDQLCSCALGAAYEAATGTTTVPMDRDICVLFPALLERINGLGCLHTIVNLNDDDGLSREEIAAWLEEQGY